MNVITIIIVIIVIIRRRVALVVTVAISNRLQRSNVFTHSLKHRITVLPLRLSLDAHAASGSSKPFIIHRRPRRGAWRDATATPLAR